MLNKVLWLSLSKVVLALSEYAYLIILVKFYGLEKYGTWVTYITIVQIMIFASLLGLDPAYTRFIAGTKDNEKVRNYFYAGLLVVTLMGGFLSLFLTLGAPFFGPQISPLFLSTSFLIGISALEVFLLNHWKAFLQMKSYALSLTVRLIFEITSVTILSLQNYSLTHIASAIMIIRLGSLLLNIFRFYRHRGICLPQVTVVRPLLSYGFPMFLSALILWTIKFSDRLIIGKLLNFSDVGKYATAYNFGAISILIIGVFQGILYPRLSDLWNQSKKSEAKTLLYNSSKCYLFIAIPSFFGLAVFSYAILNIFVPQEDWSQANFVIPCVALSLALYGIYVIFTYILRLEKKTLKETKILFVGAGLNVVLNFILVPLFNINGAAFSTLVAYLTILIATIFVSKKFFSFGFPWNFFWKALISSVLMAVCLHFLPMATFWSLILYTFVGILIYFLSMLVFRAISLKEIQNIYHHFK